MPTDDDQLSSDLASLKIDRSAPPDRRWIKWVIWLLVAAGVAAGVYFVVLPRLTSKVFKTSVEVTEISAVSPAQGSVEMTATGYVKAQDNAKVAAKASGRIAEVLVEKGKVIEAGAIIARLEDAEQKSAIESAKARVQAAKARAGSLRARAQTARAEVSELAPKLERERTLFEQGVSPKAAVTDLESRQKSLGTTVRAADAEARAAEADAAVAAAQVKELEVMLEAFTIKAPISGTVIEEPAKVGELVGPGAAPVAQISNLGSVVVEVDVPEARLYRVKEKAHVQIVLDAYPNDTFSGSVLSIGSTVDRSKATVSVKITFIDRPERVLPDMAARVNFLDRELKAEEKGALKVVVPEAAVVKRGGTDVVFVVQDDQVRLTPVKLSREKLAGGFVLVDGKPGPGTRVVKNPAPDLADGQKIKEKEGK